MATRNIEFVFRQFRKLVALRTEADVADYRMLRRFAEEHDELAFEGLLIRHGPMVWNVCRRVLHNGHDVEDAFQATFLVLLRKAGSLDSRGSLANWLYTVAYRLAMRAQKEAGLRRKHEGHAVKLSLAESDSALIWRDL